MGISEEEDVIWAELMNALLGGGDEDLNPEGIDGIMETLVPELFERCGKLIAERRENPTDDLTSVLVHAEVEGEKLEEHEIVMGFFLLMAAGNDSTKATYCSGMRALMEDEEQRRLLLDDPSLVGDAVEESLRMFPAFAHFRRTATCDTELHGQQIKEGEKVVMWYVSSNRDETRYEDPDRFDLRRKAEHQAFGAGGRHFCLGTALARLELRILIEQTLARYPEIALDGSPDWVRSAFINQLKTLPVKLGRPGRRRLNRAARRRRKPASARRLEDHLRPRGVGRLAWHPTRAGTALGGLRAGRRRRPGPCSRRRTCWPRSIAPCGSVSTVVLTHGASNGATVT